MSFENDGHEGLLVRDCGARCRSRIVAVESAGSENQALFLSALARHFILARVSPP